MILVTGSTGLVGAHLLYKLTTNNEKVRAIYRSEHKLNHVKNIFSTYTDDHKKLFQNIEWFRADILDIPSLNKAFEGVDYVYHCAAFVSFEPDKYQLLRRTNIEGTANIVNFCISNSIKKLCYVSSIATLGNELKNTCITEDSIWNPEQDHSVYAITKYGAEMEVWRGTQEGVDAVIVNPGVILGAGIWHNGSGSLFKMAHQGLKYYTAGTLGLVAIDDVISIMIALLKSDSINERYILVAENWTYKQFLQTLSESVKCKSQKKIASSTLLSFAWRLDWLKHKIIGTRRKLTKQMVHSLSSETNYSSDKIKNTLNYEFKDVNKSIIEIGNLYLKQEK